MDQILAVSTPILAVSIALNAYWAILMLGIAKVSNDMKSQAMFLLPALLSFAVVMLVVIELL